VIEVPGRSRHDRSSAPGTHGLAGLDNGGIPSSHRLVNRAVAGRLELRCRCRWARARRASSIRSSLARYEAVTCSTDIDSGRWARRRLCHKGAAHRGPACQAQKRYAGAGKPHGGSWHAVGVFHEVELTDRPNSEGGTRLRMVHVTSRSRLSCLHISATSGATAPPTTTVLRGGGSPSWLFDSKHTRACPR
jgi:hypothetical protein